MWFFVYVALQYSFHIQMSMNVFQIMDNVKTTALTQLVATTVSVEMDEHWAMAHIAVVRHSCARDT